VGIPLCVLLVEDVEDDAALIVRELRRSGYDPTFERVDTPEDFFATLTQRTWQLVLSDYSLPSFNAVEALKLLHESGLDIPFIIISGTVGEDVTVAAMRAGAHDYLVKGQLLRLGPVIARELRETAIRAEQREAAAALQKTELRFRALIEGLPDLVFVVSDGKLAYMNPLALGTLGNGSPEGMIGQPIESIIHPDDRASTIERIAEVIAGAKLPLVERRLLRRDGSPVDVQLSEQSVLFDGRVAVVTVARDVSEQKKTQNQLLVSERMASVGMLAAGVAHEINNPLASVLANLDFALAELKEYPDKKGTLNEVMQSLRETRESGERVRQIVKDLRIFSRSEDVERRGPVDVQRVLDSSLRMAWNEIRHRARLVKDFEPVPPVLANDARLGQVFLNLIVNAAQAIPEGRADKNEVRVVTRMVGRKVVIEVRDTGSGMPPEVLQRLFTPFFTTKPVGVGTGIGLSICHRIISGLGGEIGVESEVGKGTTFRIKLSSTTEEADEVTGPAMASRPLRRGKILVVDDEVMVASAIERTLRREHDVTGVASGNLALEQIAAGNTFDVILCDLMMPQMTGMELHGRLVELAPEQARRIIFLSGGAFTSAARSFLDNVPNQRIEKPFDAAQLRAIVNERLLTIGPD
jgi:PAS domain S-box-containing protein